MAKSTGYALITGASAGLGHALCRRFAEAKIDVIAVARRKDRLDSLCDAMSQEFGTRNVAIQADLSSRVGVQALVREIESRGLEVHTLVNNAGIGQQGRFDRTNLDRELATVGVNVEAAVHLSRVFVEGMVQRGSGNIVNISSIAGFQPGPYMSSYYASKAFLTCFSEGLYFELRDTGVCVTAVCPGPIYTEFAQASGTENSNLFASKGIHSPEYVASVVFDAMQAGKRTVIVGAKNKLLAAGGRFGPRAWALRISARLNVDKD